MLPLRQLSHYHPVIPLYHRNFRLPLQSPTSAALVVTITAIITDPLPLS